MLKAGSKRRRTQAQIQSDYDQKQFEEIDARDSKVKFTDAQKEIAELKAQLQAERQLKNQGEYAAQWVQEQMNKKNIALTDDNNLIITTSANTIRNGDDIMDGDDL